MEKETLSNMYSLFDGATQEELKISLQASLQKILDESVLKVWKKYRAILTSSLLLSFIIYHLKDSFLGWKFN